MYPYPCQDYCNFSELVLVKEVESINRLLSHSATLLENPSSASGPARELYFDLVQKLWHVEYTACLVFMARATSFRASDVSAHLTRIHSIMECIHAAFKWIHVGANEYLSSRMNTCGPT